MRAAVYTKYGSPDVLELKEIENPSPKDKEILVKVCATTVTSGDVRVRKADPVAVRAFNGLIKPKRTILGVEFSGVVEKIGKEVKKFRKGDQVFGSLGTEMGTYLEQLCISEEGVVTTKPENLTFEEAAAVPFGALTSLHFLRKGRVKKGDKILIYGASGSLGTAAVQLANYFGAEVTGVCSTKNIELVKTLGAYKVIDYTKENFSNRGDKYDVIFDTVGKSPFSDSVKSLKDRGYYLRAVHINPSSLIRGLIINMTTKKKVIGGISNERKEDLIFLKEIIEEGRYKPVIDKSYPLEKISEAHRYVEEGHKRGNVVIIVNSPT